MMKPNVLVVCAKGLNRSKYLSGYLFDKGYNTRYGGIESFIQNGKDYANYLTKDDIKWADIIIVVRERLLKILKKRFNLSRKKVISFDITDSKRLISEKYPMSKRWKKDKMNKKITYPLLRKAIKPYLPLENIK